MMNQIWQFVSSILRQGFPCLFHLITGLYCPGCGGTRAFRCFLAGQWAKSLYYHPVVLYGAAVAAAEVITWLLARILKKPELYLARYNLFIVIGAGIMVINCIYKNYMLLAKGIALI